MAAKQLYEGAVEVSQIKYFEKSTKPEFFDVHPSDVLSFPLRWKVQLSYQSSNPRRYESTRIPSYIVDYYPIIFSISASSREET